MDLISRAGLCAKLESAAAPAADDAPTVRPRRPVRRHALPPAILIGGEANALSVARQLSSHGVLVYALGPSDTCIRYSRHCRWISLNLDDGVEEGIGRFLLGPDARELEGSVLLACSDAGLQVLARHREQLLDRYLLDSFNPAAQRAMLDKLTTYEAARAAGVATPRFWSAAAMEQLEALRDELVFPLIVKPRLSHVFERQFGRKFIIASNFDEVVRALEGVTAAGINTLLVEWIPGGDGELASYFTYLDEASLPLLHFTKRVIRRYPVGMGSGSYHITDWVPEIIEPSLRLIREVKLLGLANIEFKRDPRDGQYKLMECNARFAASDPLVAASGMMLGWMIYNRVIGRPHEVPRAFRTGMRMWDPVRDFRAYLQLRRRGELTLGAWLRSVAHRQMLPFFRWSDPGPTLSRGLKPLGCLLGRRTKSSGG